MLRILYGLVGFCGLAASFGLTVDRFTEPATICGYSPLTEVRDFALLDVDFEAIQHRLALGQLSKARNLYEMGGNASPVAVLTIPGPKSAAHSYPVGTQVYGKAKAENRSVLGTLVESVTWEADFQGNVTLKVAYFGALLDDDEAEQSQCRVGGYYTFERATLDGCFTDVAGTLELVHPGKPRGSGEVFPYVYDIRHDNSNLLTLQSLSTEETANYNFEEFKAFTSFYGDTDFGNKWVLAAVSFDTTEFASRNGNANFGLLPKIGVAEAMITGILGMNVLLQIMDSVSQASTVCQEGCETVLCNEEAIHFVDKAVALYCGSMEGKDGTGEGVFQYALAQRRSNEFGVNTPGETTNDRIMRHFQNLQDLLVQGNCKATVQEKDSILSLLKIPIVQSVLRFAYIRDRVQILDIDDQPKAEAFGATYAASILPFVHNCHRADANVIYENLRVGSDTSAVSFHRVKEVLEKNYLCMGLTCDDIGGILTEGGFADGAGPCVTEGDKSTATAGASTISFLGVSLAVMLLAAIGYFYMKRSRVRSNNRRRRHIRHGSGNIAAVSSIS